MTDRRSFLAKVTGALAGLVASKHITLAPAAEPALIDVPLVPPPPVVPQYSIPGPKDKVLTFTGGIPNGHVCLVGIPVDDVWSCEITVAPWATGSGFIRGNGRLVTYFPIRDPQAESMLEWATAAPDGLQEFGYKGWIELRVPSTISGSILWVAP